MPVDPIAAFLAFEEQSRTALGGPPAFVDEMFDCQKAVFNDPSKRKAMLTTRRAGKTETFSRWLLDGMMRWGGEDAWSGYLTLTKGQSRRNLEGSLRSIIRRHRLPITFSEPDGQITLTNGENGHRLWLGGVDDLRKAERYRGNKWRRFGIDEGGAWPADVLSYVIDDAIEAGLTDVGGELLLGGTPGVIPVGYFYEVTTPGEFLDDGRRKMPQWPTHQWSVLQNPHHPWGPGPYLQEWLDDPDIICGHEGLEAHRKKKGWATDHPTFVREYLGQWSADPEKLIYRADPGRNQCAFGEWPELIERVLEEFAGERLHWVLGIDVGQNHETAFVLTVSIGGRPHVYALRAWGGEQMMVPQRASEMMRCKDALERAGQHISFVMDPGGGGAILAADFSRYSMAVEAAKKTEKAANIQLVQGALLAGNLLVNSIACTKLLDEWSCLPWNDDRTNHDKRFADHCADALLYALRRHPVYEHWEKESAPYDSPEYHDDRIEELRRNIVADIGLRRQQNQAQTPTQRKMLQRRREHLAKRRRMY